MNADWHWDQPVHYLARNQLGIYWATTREQFGNVPHLIQFDEGRWKGFQLQPELEGAQIKRVARDSYGRVWLATENCLAIEERGKFNPINPEWMKIDFLAPSSQGGLWLAVDGHIRLFKDGKLMQDLEHTLGNIHSSPALLKIGKEMYGSARLAKESITINEIAIFGQTLPRLMASLTIVFGSYSKIMKEISGSAPRLAA